MLRALYEELSEARHGLAVVLAGEPVPVTEMMGLHASLAARFPLIVSFPGYSGGQLGHVFAALAAGARFTLGPAAAEKAAVVLAAAQDGRNGSGRLAVALLGYAAIAQARRLGDDLAGPLTIIAADLPDRVELRGPAAGGPAPGLYLLRRRRPAGTAAGLPHFRRCSDCRFPGPAWCPALTARAGKDADRYWSLAAGGALAPKCS